MMSKVEVGMLRQVRQAARRERRLILESINEAGGNHPTGTCFWYRG